MPTGKVKFYDSEKGFGFVSTDDPTEGGDVFVPSSALPEGVTQLKSGARVEFGIVEGRRGAQALSLRLLDPAQSVTANRKARDRKPAEEMVVIVEDVITLLDSVQSSLRRGHYPDRAHGKKVAQVLRAVADDLDA
ncbi:putative cold-shock DNA-binding protein [Knoellia remsis]|uniref:Putative cold-shock DNA-binding protein n=1 Tax=Knoellia remsis TaxID=407159 RepID=A0A2T0U6B1_9MICO|nr:cold shock domain-containing protein [Knoellia remsis]PRY53465.1 putative cold-shock DNA-binding protein [Knoellia remsis]